ncbi:MAG: universal stress protein [Labilithrix sp.]|nr:universal stress protein [Labilithrix sp.]
MTARIVILAAVDDTPVSDDVVYTAATLGRTLAGAELHLVNVVEPLAREGENVPAIPTPTDQLETARVLIEKVRERAREMFPGRIVGHLAAGMPWREIVQLATNLKADLVVLGNHRRGRIERWFIGSVCEQVLRKAPCAVLVAKPREPEHPAIPEIEPPCADCLAVQRESGGQQLWCNAHTRNASRSAHLHYASPPSFGVGSMLLRPEG